jgi:hypothetical protein
MKYSFLTKTFAPRTFRASALAGPVTMTVLRPVRAAMFIAGATAGRHFHTGATAGQVKE